MDGRILALLIVVVAALAITDERTSLFRGVVFSAARQAVDDEDAEIPRRIELTGDVVEHSRRPVRIERVKRIERIERSNHSERIERIEHSERIERHREMTERRDDFVTETIPVADLLLERADGIRPSFGSSPELIAFLKQVTGRKHWRRAGKIEWLDRRAMIRVTQTDDVVEEIRNHLERCRSLDTAELRVTIRVFVLPAESDIGPQVGRASVLSAREAGRLIRRAEKQDNAQRYHCSVHRIPSGDVIYACTAARLSEEGCYRGVNVVCRAASDAHGATLLPIAYRGDLDRVDWNETFVAVGQTVLYVLPVASPADTDVRDATRALVLVTLDSVTPASR